MTLTAAPSQNNKIESGYNFLVAKLILYLHDQKAEIIAVSERKNLTGYGFLHLQLQSESKVTSVTSSPWSVFQNDSQH